MPKSEKRNGLNIKLLNDFIYTILFNASAEDKKGLSGKYLSACENIKATKKFIDSATREEKEFLLAQFGYQFFYFISPYRPSNTTLKEYIERGGYKITDIKKEGLYVHSDRELMHLVGLTCKSVHNPSYSMNLELMRQSYHVKKWSRAVPVKDPTGDVAEADSVLMRTLLSATITMNYQAGITGLSDIQCQILLYLYVNRNKERSMSDLDDVFSGYKGRYTPSGFKTAINSLVLNQYIQRSAVDKTLTITSLGIKKCQEYRDSVLINNNNF
jgi:hypothetical protein